MSTNYYFTNRKREELRKEFEKEAELTTKKTEKELMEFISKNEDKFEYYDICDSIKWNIERLRFSLQCLISSREINICTRTFKGVRFTIYNGFEHEGLGSFFDMKSLRKFHERNKEDWALMNEYVEEFESFDDFILDLDIEKKDGVSWV